MRRLKHLFGSIDRDTLLFFFKINCYGFGSMAFWSAINTVLLPARAASTAPSSLEGSAIGLISMVGLGLAVIVQPLAGRMSDAWRRSDPRRPFMLAGTVLVVPGIVLFGAAPTFVLLLAGFVLMQCATNIAQAAFQAFIPDHVEPDQRGIASGAKNVLTVVGAAAGLLGAQGLTTLGAPEAIVLGYLGGIIVLTGVLSLVWVPRTSPDEDGASMASAMSLRALWRESLDTLREHATFRWAVLAQFLFMLGIYPAQRFLLIFLRDRFGHGAERWVSVGAVLAILLAIVVAAGAGALSDAVGRKPVLMIAAALGSAGLVLIGFSLTLMFVAVAGALIAVGFGSFLAVNWALMNDDLPEGQAASSLGVANIATAGAGALAGIYGPIVDVLNSIMPQGTYQVTFGLAGITAALSIVALRRVNDGRAQTSPAGASGQETNR